MIFANHVGMRIVKHRVRNLCLKSSRYVGIFGIILIYLWRMIFEDREAENGRIEGK